MFLPYLNRRRSSVSGGGGPISFVGGAIAGYGNTGGSTKTLALTALTGGSDAAPINGDVVVALGSVYNGQSAAGMMVSTGYTLAVSSTWPAVNVWYKRMGSTPDTGVDMDGATNSTTGLIIGAMVFRGVSAVTPLGGITPTSASGADTTNADPPSITALNPGSAVLAFAGRSALDSIDVTPVFDSPVDLDGFFTALANESRFDAMAGLGYKLDQSGLFDPAAWTGNTQNAWNAHTLVLEVA